MVTINVIFINDKRNIQVNSTNLTLPYRYLLTITLVHMVKIIPWPPFQ